MATTGVRGAKLVTAATVRQCEQAGREFFTSNGQTYTLRTCGRCGGCGRYSFNLMDMDKCYGCMGAGMVAVPGTPDEVAAQEAKRAVARERDAVRKQARQEKEAATRLDEESRILAGIGCQIPPMSRRAPKIMTSAYNGSCRYCAGDISKGKTIAYGDGARHPGCYGDMLLDDIADTQQSDQDTAFLNPELAF